MLKSIQLLPVHQLVLGTIYHYLGQPDQAIAQIQSALELDPHYYPAHMYLGSIHIQAGNLEDGIRACEKAMQLASRNAAALGGLGWAYARAGRMDEAQKLLKELEELVERSFAVAAYIGRIHLGLGNTDKALDWFEKSIDSRDGMLAHFHIAPFYDPLRSHPRYRALLRKMNLEA